MAGFAAGPSGGTRSPVYTPRPARRSGIMTAEATVNLFSALRRYRPTEGRDPLEDFVTEAWRWTLESHPVVASAFLARAGVAPGATVHWRTQARLDEGRCVVDLLGEVKDGPVVVCEHKVWARLSPGQLARYRAAAAARWPDREVIVALITGRTWQHTEPADLRLTWSDVYALVGANTASPLLAQFREFLKEHGLGPVEPVLSEAALAWAQANRFEAQLLGLFSDLGRRLPTMPVAERIGALCGAPLSEWPPLVPDDRPRWGRLGLDLPSRPNWRPGLFVGVLVDTTNHQVGWSRPALGPDLCVILSFQLREPGVPDRDAFLFSAEFEGLVRALRERPDLDVVDMRAGANPWHALHLRRPLVEVLGHDPAHQLDRVAAAAEEMLGALVADGSLASLAARLRRPA